MGTKEHREQKKLEIKELILGAARELLIEAGGDAISMRKVAKKIGYSPAAIYLHFANKEELLCKLCLQGLAELAKQLKISAQDLDPFERLRQTALAYIRFGVEYPNHYELMFMKSPPSKPTEHDFNNPAKDVYAFLTMLVQRAIDAGLFRKDLTDAFLILQMLWGAMHGVISFQIAKCNGGRINWIPTQERANFMAETIFRGLLRDPRQYLPCTV